MSTTGMLRVIHPCTKRPLKGLNLTVWLLDKGADLNARNKHGNTPLHVAESLDVLDALLDRNADPILPNNGGMPPVMNHMLFGRAGNVKRLLQDPRVRATVDMRNQMGDAAIHLACNFWHEQSATSLVHLLFAAGANPLLANRRGETPLVQVREHHPSHYNLIAFLEEAIAEAEKTSLLVKVRRFAAAPRSATTTHSYLECRLVQEVPQVTLAPLTTAHNDEEEEEEERKLRSMLTFVTGMEGGADGQGLKKEHFLEVMKYLMPSWDPLRRGRGDDLQRL